MKIIIGVYDRVLSHHLAITLSSKKFFPIEAESFEEIPALLERHPGAMLISEETALNFYQNITNRVGKINIFLLFHPNLSTMDLLKLQDHGIQLAIPYSEDASEIVDALFKAADQKQQKQDTNDYSIVHADDIEHKDVAIHAPKVKKWLYGELQGFNSSKVAIKIDGQKMQDMIFSQQQAENLLMYLQGMNIRMYADLVYQKQDLFVFRYRKMSQSDAQRLAQYIYYCQQKKTQEKIHI